MKNKIISLIITLNLIFGKNFGKDFYISLEGSIDNDGSNKKPWHSLSYALKKVGGGNTFILMPGQYNEQIHLKSEYKGTRENPTIIKSHKKWSATISIYEEFCAIIDYECNWTIIDGLKLTNSNLGGILIRSDNNLIKNCWIINNKNGIYIHQRINISIENSLIEFNGNSIVDNHGISGSGSNINILNNVLRHNGSYGIHLYPWVERLVMINNIVHHQVSGHGFHATIDIREDDSKI